MAHDRNQQVKDREQAQRELGQQLQKFARELAAGKAAVVDRFGHKIEAGVFVLYRPDYDLIYEVLDAAPILDLSHPPGWVKLKLTTSIEVKFLVGQRAMTLTKCGEKAKDATGDALLQSPSESGEATVASDPTNLADSDLNDHDPADDLDQDKDL